MAAYRLQTERLVVRTFSSADVDNLMELDADPAIMHFVTGGRPTPRDEIAPSTGRNGCSCVAAADKTE